MNRPVRRSALLALGPLVLALGSCDRSPTELPPAPISELRASSTLDSVSLVGSRVEVGVRVVRADGSWAVEEEVAWDVASGAGTVLGPVATRTDSGGRAEVRWELGGTQGDQRLRASVGALEISFETSAVADAPARLEWVSPPDAELSAGDSLLGSVRVLNPVGLPVSGEVEGVVTLVGPPGSEEEVVAAQPTAFIDGLAELALPPRTARGIHRIGVKIQGVDEALTRELRVRAGSPASIALAGTVGHFAGVSGGEVDTPPLLLVRDAYLNPVPDIKVQGLVLEGGGVLEGVPFTTDHEGLGRPGRWRLGPEVGEQQVRFSVGDVGLDVTATARSPREPTLMVPESSPGRSYEPGTLADAAVVRVLDQDGVPVEGAWVVWRTAHGSGHIEGDTLTRTDAEGLSRQTGWRLGPREGEQSLEARVADHPEIHTTFTATSVAPSAFEVVATYISQATQTLAGEVPLVPNRAGVFRAFVRPRSGATAQGPAPDLLLELVQGGTVYRSYSIPAPTGLPVADATIDEGAWDRSYNRVLAPSDIRSGMRYRLTLADGRSVLWPSEEGVAPSTTFVPALSLHVVPVHIEETGLTGDVSPSSLDSYLKLARGVLPFPDIQAEFGPTFVWTGARPAADGSGWGALLSALQQARSAGGSSSLWYGVVQTDYDSGVAGMGYIGHPVSVGYDGSARGWVLAHEVGHNLGRRHSPCGSPGNADADYRPLDGSIGAWGLDVEHGHRFAPDAGDFMGYCNGWVGPHTFTAMQAHAAAASAPARTAGLQGPSLQVWGHMTGETMVLEPAYVSDSGSAPHGDGGVEVELLGIDGAVLHRSEAPVHPMDHVDGASFSTSIPLSSMDLDRVATIRVRDVATGRLAERRATGVSGTPELRIERGPGGRMELRWDPADAEMVVVRDPGSGAVVGFARDGRFPLIAPDRGLDLQVTDGIRPRRSFTLPPRGVSEGILRP